MRALAVGFVLLYAHVANADELHVEVSGDACDLSALAHEVSTLAASESASTPVHVDVSREDDKLVARVAFPERTFATRSVTADSCEALVDALGLVIAMALPEAERSVRTEPAPVRAEPLAVTAQLPIEPHRDVALEAYVSGGSSVSSHGPRGLILLGARVRRASSSLALQLRVDAPEERVVTTHASIRVLRSELSLGPCLHRGRFAGCAAVTVGALRGEGIGLRSAETAYAPLVAGALRLVWEQPLSARIGVRAALETQLLVTSAQFEVDYMPVWTSQQVEASGGLGLVARFL